VWNILIIADSYTTPALEAWSSLRPNPTTSIYNAGVVNFYNATGSLARFEKKNILFYFENVVAVNSKVVGLAPDWKILLQDGELILFEYMEEHPPLLSLVGMCSKVNKAGSILFNQT
jgi:hypothetical protein